MTYPEEIREKYNECMYEERAIIENFLVDVRNLCKGFKGCSWKLETPVEVVTTKGGHVKVFNMRLDRDKCVVFLCSPIFAPDKDYEWECDKFAYGELSKVIKTLPSIDEVTKTKMMADIKRIVSDDNFAWHGKEHVFCDAVKILSIERDHDSVYFYGVNARESHPATVQMSMADVGTEGLVAVRNYLYADRLRHSPQYKEVMKFLASEENLRVEFNDYGDATFYLKESCVEFDVAYIKCTDMGELTIVGNELLHANDATKITLTEEDIEPEYLDAIIPLLRKRKWEEIMDDSNNHDTELVRKINEAWNDEKYHHEFGDILLAIGRRDKKEIAEKLDCETDNYETAMANAHEILQHICDDQDLETILSFIRYKE